jgi:hypothetical protein
LSSELDLPKQLRNWLASTKSVQSDNFLIKIKAILLRGFTNNLVRAAKKITYYSTIHRFFLQIIRLKLETNPLLRSLFLRKQYYTGLSDAVSCIFIGGLCTAQTNFAAAMLRAIGIPVKILIVTAFGQTRYIGEKKWLDSQHYMFEFYCPNYGWIKSTPGKIGYQPKNYIISRIVYPEDENLAGNGLSYYGGMTPWFWITNENVSLLSPDVIRTMYKIPRGKVSGVPAIRMWTENKIDTYKNKANSVFILTQNVWKLFTKYIGMNSNSTYNNILENAVKYQKKALEYLILSDVKNYERYLNNAYNQYNNLK